MMAKNLITPKQIFLSIPIVMKKSSVKWAKKTRMAFILQTTLWVAFNPERKYSAEQIACQLRNHITFFYHNTAATEIYV